MISRRSVSSLVVVLLIPVFASRRCRAEPGQPIDRSIARGVAWLYEQQEKDGTWEGGPPKRGRVSTIWGGHTAIAVYALLAAGEKPNNPKLHEAITFLEKADDVNGTYALALRSQVWWLLPSDKTVAASIRRDTELLRAACYESGPNSGFYTYGLSSSASRRGPASPVQDDFPERKPPRRNFDSAPDPNSQAMPAERIPWPRGKYDHSNSQYGVLGMWALAEAGGEVPLSYWHMVDMAWRKAQNEDGGWDYIDGRKSTASMTAAGIATLYITQDFLLASSSWTACNPRSPDTNVTSGLKWMDGHISKALDGRNTYTMYGIERIGLASGRKYFGTIPWFKAGAKQLIDAQNEDGSWDAHFAGNDDIASTCYALLFLSRGRAPVMMNKLEYGASVDSGAAGRSTATTRPAASGVEVWNERPRDLSNLAKWFGHVSEGFYNWQTVSLNASPEDLHDAPILYVCGRDRLNFDEAELVKLRTFVFQGGMIVGNADCGRDAFSASFRELGRKLFGKYEFRDLPAAHIIFTGQQYRASKWKSHPRLLGLSNGIRELMILIPDADVSRTWQSGGTKTREEAFQLGADLFVYMTGGADPRVRPRPWLVAATAATQPTKSIRLARLQEGDNPDPEPLAWQRMAAILHNEQHLQLEVEPVQTGEGKLRDAGLVHWTGTTHVTLSDAGRKEIAEFVRSGGTLIIDSAGGSAAFCESIEVELKAIFGAQAAELDRPLPADHEVYSAAGAPTGPVSFRSFTRNNSVGINRSPRIRGLRIGDRIAVFYSPEDLTEGLVGEQVDGVQGYDPVSATRMMSDMIAYAVNKSPPSR